VNETSSNWVCRDCDWIMLDSRWNGVLHDTYYPRQYSANLPRHTPLPFIIRIEVLRYIPDIVSNLPYFRCRQALLPH
jgi:hypothetical protein